jgi:hypothetical protein
VAQNALAALTAELEALQLPERRSKKADEDSGLSDSNASPRAVSGSSSGMERLQQLVNELVQDNDLLQSSYLELAAVARHGKEPVHMTDNEIAILRAGKARLEHTLKEALADKTMLEQALVKATTGKR